MLGKLKKSYTEYLMNIQKKYVAAGNEWPAAARTVMEWGDEHGMCDEAEEHRMTRLAKDLADAMRQEVHEDPQGRVTRTMAAAPVEKLGNDGKTHQSWLWADIRDGNHEHTVSAFLHRRRQVRGDVDRLKIDIASYNDNYKPADVEPIQMSFDFNDDANIESVAS